MGVQDKIVCAKCGKQAPKIFLVDICKECAEKELEKAFKEEPFLIQYEQEQIKKYKKELKECIQKKTIKRLMY